MSDFIREKKTEIRENRIETASTLSKSNPKEINQSRDTKSIKIDVSLEDHQYLSEQAKQRKISNPASCGLIGMQHITCFAMPHT